MDLWTRWRRPDPASLPPLPPVARSDAWEHGRQLDDMQREYQSQKLAALEAQAELAARARRKGYDLDLTTRRGRELD